MRRPPYRLVALAIVIALAGCAGSAAVGPASPAPRASPSPTPESVDAIAGIENRTVTNASALVAAHQQHLLEDGFVVVLEQRATANTTKHYRNSTRLVRTKAAPALARYHVYERERLAATPNRSAVTLVDETWVNQSVAVRMRQLPGRTVYEPYHFQRYPDVLTGTDSLVGPILAGAGQFTVTDVRRVRDRTVYTFEATVDEPSRGSRSDRDEIRFTVDDRGVIRTLTIESRTVIPNSSLRSVDVDHPVAVVTVAEYRLARLGEVDVPPPVWIDDARDSGSVTSPSARVEGPVRTQG